MFPFAWVVLFSYSPVVDTIRDFSSCHKNFDLHPDDGVLERHTFKWLGFVTYLHVTTGLPHHSRAPRVVLVHQQFAVGISVDLLYLPKNYKLGNVVFGDYEREEMNCGLTKSQIKMGEFCPPTYLEIPFIDITPHPEFSKFGVSKSVALVKLLRPIESHYVVPICLPTPTERARKKSAKVVFLIDYLSATPRDFNVEKMAKKSLRLYTHADCKKHRMQTKQSTDSISHLLCTSGCGVRSGAPIITHSMVGAFELVGLAAGGGACAHRSQRYQLNEDPPLFVDVYPFALWITNTVLAHVLPLPYPNKLVPFNAEGEVSKAFGYLRKRKSTRQGWSARTFIKGDWCFRSESKKKPLTFFYSEKFQVHDPVRKLSVTLVLSTGLGTTILCVQMNMPNNIVTPDITGIGSCNVTVVFSSEWYPTNYFYSIGIYGKNTSRENDQKHVIQ